MTTRKLLPLLLALLFLATPALADLPMRVGGSFGNTPVVFSTTEDFQQISVGSHELGLTYDGRILAWGFTNASGQLGDGSTVTHAEPQPVVSTGVLAGRQVVSVVARFSSSFALLDNGTIAAWGDNSDGQLGDGTTINRSVPVLVAGISTAVQVDFGKSHAIALLKDGTVRTWGDNGSSQLGNGTNIDSLTPVTVSGLSNVTSIGVGNHHSLAVLANGQLWGWGNNDFNQIATSGPARSVPIRIGTLTNIVKASGGIRHSIALRSTGSVFTWGDGTNGALGRTFSGTSPDTVSGLGPAVDIVSGEKHCLVRLADGTVWGWGSNTGMLGSGTTSLSTNSPVNAIGVSNCTALSTGDTRTYFLRLRPPTAQLLAPTGVTNTGITLRASLSANGVATNAVFDYGLTNQFGNSASATHSPNDAIVPVTTTATLSGLTPGATYYYRLQAMNAQGTGTSVTGTFTTPNLAPIGGSLTLTPSTYLLPGAVLVARLSNWQDPEGHDPLSYATALDNHPMPVPGTATTFLFTTPQADGIHAVRGSVTDVYGASTITTTNFTVDGTAPVVTLLGQATTMVEVGANYVEAGATASDALSGNVTNTITVTGTVNTLAISEFQLTYTARDLAGNIGSKTRIVKVVDTTSPVITMAGANPLTLEAPAFYMEPGATAQDTVWPGLIATASGTVNGQLPGTYTITYTATDGSGNVATRTRMVNIVDTTAPVITLNGASPMTIEAGGIFTDPGATALDASVGTVGVNVAGSVNAAVPGNYTLTYSASDGRGNAITKTRTVHVVDTTNPEIGGIFAPLTLQTGPTGKANLPDYIVQAIRSDNVAVASVTQEPIPGTAVAAGVTIVTLTAADAAANTKSVTFPVTVLDATAPQVSPPQGGFTPTTLTTGDDATIALPDYTGQAATSDNVAVFSTIQSPLPGTAMRFGLSTVTITVADNAGNSSTVNFPLIVLDGTKPDIAAPETGFIPASVTTGAGGTVLLPNYIAQAVRSDNVDVLDVTQAPTPGTALIAGTTTVTLVATDGAGNTRSTQFDLAVIDGTKPTITAPFDGFGPLELVADGNGTISMPDYTLQAVTADNVGVTGVTQVPATETIRLFGKTIVTLTAHDAAGNTQETSFEIVVRLDGPAVNALASIGGAVPGAGVDSRIPANSKFTSLGLPAVGDSRVLTFLGKWKSDSGAGSGIFVGNPPSLLVAAGEDAPGIGGGKFKTLQNPLLAPDGSVAFAATVQGTGIKTANDQGVWMSSGGVHTLVLREGTQINGAPDKFKLKSVIGVSLHNGELLAMANLLPSPKLITAANDTTLLRVTPAGATILLRERSLLDLNDGFPAAGIKTITALRPVTGSPGHGRWQTDDGGAVVHLTLANKRSVILGIAGDGSFTRSLAVGDGIPNLPDSAIWNALNLPAVEPGGQSAVARGTLTAVVIPGLPPTVTPKNDVILAFSPDANSAFSMFAREGSPAMDTGGAVYASFLEPLVNDAGAVAFSATLSGTGVSSVNKTGIWWGPPGGLALLARTNSLVPGVDGQPSDARWSRFVSLALPGGAGCGTSPARPGSGKGCHREEQPWVVGDGFHTEVPPTASHRRLRGRKSGHRHPEPVRHPRRPGCVARL